MAGVAGPMLGRSRSQGTRFLTGLLAGGLIASAVLATVFFGIGEPLSWILPRTAARIAAGVLLLLAGIADLANRTPHIWRQVPQALLRRLSPGRLGLAWGFDLSLLFTTQKSTSLTWSALTLVTLLEPGASWAALPAMTVIGVLTITLRSVTWRWVKPNDLGDRKRPWFGPMRRAAGLAQVVLGVLIATGVLTP